MTVRLQSQAAKLKEEYQQRCEEAGTLEAQVARLRGQSHKLTAELSLLQGQTTEAQTALQRGEAD